MRPAPSDQPPDAVQGCIEACRRCEEVVAAVVEQDPAVFAAIGPHLRHCVDHFRLLLAGLRSGVVDYDARPREPHLERDPAAVVEAIRSIARCLVKLDDRELARALVVTQTVAPGRPRRSATSCLERELAFLSGHTIHHIALMVLTGRGAGVAIPASLAVAYSTGAHRDALAAIR